MLQGAVAVILVLGGLIFFHELGHFVIARLFGIGVRVFSLGFGPRLAWVKKGKTEYRLSAIPLGGYVNLVGERPDEEEPDSEFGSDENFSLKPPWQRMLVVAAGPVFNFLLAWLIYSGLFWVNGRIELLPSIGEVKKESPAAKSGLMTGDLILTVNGEKVAYWSELASGIRGSTAKELHLTYKRGRDILETKVVPELQPGKNIFGESVTVPIIGIVSGNATVAVAVTFPEAVRDGAVQTWTVSKLMVEGIIKLIERVIPLDNVGGPIMIAQMVGKQASEGMSSVLFLAALISVNLGLLNLLPIPVLDGGHILFFALEMIVGRPLNEKWRQYALRAGMAVLFALMALAIFNDVSRLLKPA